MGNHTLEQRAARLYSAGLISRLVMRAAMTPDIQTGIAAWCLARRRQRASEVVDLHWRRFEDSSCYVVERELTTDRLLAIRVVSWACGWRDMHRYAVAALAGDEGAKRRLRRMLYPLTRRDAVSTAISSV